MNARRYPRTMQEAFGPHTSRDLHEMPPPPRSRFVRIVDAVCWVVGAVLFFGLMYAVARFPQ